jgi:phosphonatase-like hydrolase
MPIQLAVFDMAGTTVADHGDVITFFQKAFKKNGVIVKSGDLQPVRGLKKMDAVHRVLDAVNVEAGASLVEKIHEDFINELTAYYRTSPVVKPAPGAEEIFLWLKQKGIRVTLNTGFPRPVADLIINRFHWHQNGLTDEYITSDDVEQGRPYPFMIRELMKNAGVRKADEVVKIGDTPVDIQEGRNAGCGLVIGITTGASSRDKLEEWHPDHIIDHLTELKTLIK